MESNSGSLIEFVQRNFEDLPEDLKVSDTYGDIFCHMDHNTNSVTLRTKYNDCDNDPDMHMMYELFLSKYIYSVESAMKRIYHPVHERDNIFKTRTDFFLNSGAAHDVCSITAPNKLQIFSELQFPGYVPENVVFQKFPFASVQRWGAENGLSYLQAASLVQHYAVSIHTGTNAPILDVGAYVKSYRDMAVWRHIEGMTLESESTLRHLLLPDKRLLNSTNTARHIVQYLREHHVGLVSKFRIHPEFRDPDRFHYHGVAKGDGTDSSVEEDMGDSRHSMCLVGYREVLRGGRPYYFFLLQNSWQRKQFVEVDQRYLGSVRAMVHFICEPQSEIGAHLPTLQLSGRYVESPAGVDACDGEAFAVGCDCCGF